jgi:hypothetical protein
MLFSARARMRVSSGPPGAMRRFERAAAEPRAPAPRCSRAAAPATRASQARGRQAQRQRDGPAPEQALVQRRQRALHLFQLGGLRARSHHRPRSRRRSAR